MKTLYLLLLLTSSLAYSQTNVYPPSGNVGIGTTSPNAKITFNNLNDGTNQPDGISWYNTAPLDYGIFRTAGPWASPDYQQLKLNFLTGIILNPGSDYGKSFVDIQGGGLRVTSGKLKVAGQISSGYSYIENTTYFGSNYTRTNFGSNVYWDVVANRWQVDAIGNNDFSSIIHPNADGLAFITAPTIANAPRTLTNGEFMSFERMRITAYGDVGIGTPSPGFKLHIQGSNPNSDLMTLGSTLTGNFAITSADGGAYGLFAGVSNTGRAWLQAGRYDVGTAYDFILQASGGNVLVGKTSQMNNAHRLDVNGSIRSNEVVVNVTGADFVFDKAYDLKPLDQVERYILENKHLPDIQSAREMEENGLAVGNMEMKLLQKVEELTLYMIALKKEIEVLKGENNKLKK